MILLREKGAHGASARCEQICMALPQRSKGSTLKNHMLLIANTTTVASQTDPISPTHMASTSQTASSNRQAMTAQPKLQKSYLSSAGGRSRLPFEDVLKLQKSPHAPPRNRKLNQRCRKSVVTKVSCKAFGLIIPPRGTERLLGSHYDA